MGQDLERARTLFLEHDGSLFYMSRSGIDREYLRLGVNPDVEAGWLAELTEARLRELHDDGNWASVHFLWHHGDYAHIADVLAAEPMGVLWEWCAFLEERLKYIAEAERRRFVSHEVLEDVARRTVQATDNLNRRARSEHSRSRVESIARRAFALAAGSR